MSYEGCEFLLHLECGRINQPYLKIEEYEKFINN